MLGIYCQNQRRKHTVSACWPIQSEIISDKSPSLIPTNSTRLSQRYIVNVQSDMSVQKITTKHRHGPRAHHFATCSLDKWLTDLCAQRTWNLSMIELCRPFVEGIHAVYCTSLFCCPTNSVKVLKIWRQQRNNNKWRALLLATLQAYFVKFSRRQKQRHTSWRVMSENQKKIQSSY